MIKNFYRVIFFLLFSTLQFAQEEQVVAKVGDYIIYESEFNERFDFSAHPKLMQKSDQLEAKKEFLKQLIAEKLLSLDAKEKGYDTLKVITDIITPLENMFVRDALYSHEIKDKISLKPVELREGIERIKKNLSVGFIFSKNENESRQLYNSLLSGGSFDSLMSLRPEAKDNPKEITFGTMEKSFEDSLYKLKPGEFTQPISTTDGHYILKVFEIKNNTEIKNEEMMVEDVRRIISTRAEQKLYLDFYQNFFNDTRITADKEIFELFIDGFVPAFQKKYPEEDKDLVNKYHLNGVEVTSILNTLSADLKLKKFIGIKNKIIMPDYFLNQLSHTGFYVRDITEKNIRASLSSYIRKFIEDELLTLHGLQQNLGNSPDVKKYIGMWKDSYLSKLLMTGMFDSVKVSEQEAYSIYEQNEWKEEVPDLVNIIEILTDSLQVVETVLNELAAGKDIRELAALYTIRDSLRTRRGETGFFSPVKFGEIGKAALDMKIGDVYGPIKLNDGYSIFKLIDRIPDTTKFTKSYDEVKQELISHLTLLKFEKYVNEYNAALAKKYGITINENVLERLENVYLNLVVVRYMGFGGQIFAVPYTEQFSGWYDIWQNNVKVVP